MPFRMEGVIITIYSLSKDYLMVRSIYRLFFSLKDISVNEKLLSL